MQQYLQLLKDFLAALKAGEYWKAYLVLVKIQQVIADLFGPTAPVGTMSADEQKEASDLRLEVNAALTALESGASPAAIGDGKIIAWLIKIGLIVIGIPLPLEAPTE